MFMSRSGTYYMGIACADMTKTRPEMHCFPCFGQVRSSRDFWYVGGVYLACQWKHRFCHVGTVCFEAHSFRMSAKLFVLPCPARDVYRVGGHLGTCFYIFRRVV